MALESHNPSGLHGPKCWVLSALIGAALGYVLSIVLPASGAGSSRSPHVGADAPLVIETRADGTRAIRVAADGVVDLPATIDLSNPADLQIVHALHDGAASKQDGGVAAGHGAGVPLALCIPFAALLLSIAVIPFINEKFWHRHYPDFAFLLGALVLVYCLAAYGSHGRHMMRHAGVEYYSFIALVGGLYVVSGGILIDIRSRGRATTNTALLALGAVLANIVGTTGASVLLIRPFMRMNKGRLRPIHVVFFIFIVSNCGGCLTPIGDPPLYLGYLKGVPFFWTLNELWPMWLVTNGTLLAMFFVVDSFIPRPPQPESAAFDPHEQRPIIAGLGSLGFLALLVAGVFIDPLLKKHYKVEGLPIGATFQIIIAAAAYITARPSIHHANQFTFGPVKEVGFLFVGIFLTMAPALEYLRANAGLLGLESPTQFYFGTGVLSAVLDNAPTYLSFLQVAFGVLHLPLTPDGVAEFIGNAYAVVHSSEPGGPAPAIVRLSGVRVMEAISLGAVFFGAMTYIGNGPNFMVKSMVDSTLARGNGLGVRMPSFFGYLGWAVVILAPVLVLNWALFIR